MKHDTEKATPLKVFIPFWPNRNETTVNKYVILLTLSSFIYITYIVSQLNRKKEKENDLQMEFVLMDIDGFIEPNLRD